jgi:hypothetical protein
MRTAAQLGEISHRAGAGIARQRRKFGAIERFSHLGIIGISLASLPVKQPVLREQHCPQVFESQVLAAM